MAEKKTNWEEWIKEKLGDHPVESNKFGLMAQMYAWYRGDQYRVWDQRLGLLREVNIARETRSIRNICRPLVDLFTSKMLKGDPEPRFRPYPDNTEDSDQSLSVVGNGMSQFWWRTAVGGSAKLRHQTQWGAITGIGVSKLYYNKNKVSGNYVGEVEWKTLNPFHFFCNADARSDEEMRWGCERFPADTEVIEDDFNLPRGELSPDEKHTIEEARIAGGKNVDQYVMGEDTSTVIVHDIWIKACKDYPNGKHVIWAGGKTLVEEDNTEPDMLPFFTFRVKPDTDDIYGEGVLKNVLPIQRDINRMESIVVGNTSAFGNAKILINRASNVIRSQINNEEAGVVEWDGTQKPELLNGVIVPSHIVNSFWDNWRKAMQTVGFSEAGRGDIPYRGSQTSPGVIKELKQSEDVIFAQDVAEATEYVQRIMRRYFYLAKKYYAEPRIIDIVGDNKRPEVITFVAQKFIKDPDFEISIGSGFSQSQEARMDQIIQFAQTGIFDRIPNIDWGAIGKQLLDYAGLNKISENTFRDERQAKRNLQTILGGEDAAFSPYSNLEAHMKVFTEFINEPEYDYLPLDRRASIDSYIQAVQQAQMMKQMQQMQQMQMMQAMMAGGQGNQQKQIPTASEAGEAAGQRRMAEGQPPSPDMDQGGETNAPIPGA